MKQDEPSEPTREEAVERWKRRQEEAEERRKRQQEHGADGGYENFSWGGFFKFVGMVLVWLVAAGAIFVVVGFILFFVACFFAG